MDDVYKNINYYNPTTRRKFLIVFDDMLLILWLIKNVQPNLKNYLLDVENLIYLLYLSHNLIKFYPLSNNGD